MYKDARFYVAIYMGPRDLFLWNCVGLWPCLLPYNPSSRVRTKMSVLDSLHKSSYNVNMLKED